MFKAITGPSKTAKADGDYTAPSSGPQWGARLQIRPIPSNGHTLLASAFVRRIHFDVRSDIRYHPTWAFGIFLCEVPRRLGLNAALDAAAVSLLISHQRFALGGKELACRELSAYSHALDTLRVCLDDAALATTAETLTAVMILMLCQVSLRRA